MMTSMKLGGADAVAKYHAEYALDVTMADDRRAKYYGEKSIAKWSRASAKTAEFKAAKNGDILGGFDIRLPRNSFGNNSQRAAQKSDGSALPMHAHDVEIDQFKTVMKGFDLQGKKLTQNAGSSKRNSGFDLTTSPPKSVSVLAWLGRDVTLPDGKTVAEAVREELQAAHQAAIQFGLDHGAFMTQRGSGSRGGMRREPVAEVISARFLHDTSRAGDPQLHIHGVVANAARRHDGTWGALEDEEIKRWAGTMGAVFRSDLARRLEERLGVRIERNDKAFEVAGVPRSLCYAWSTRSREIDAEARRRGISLEDKTAIRQLVLTTRRSKSELPDEATLEDIWRADEARTLSDLGTTRDGLLAGLMRPTDAVMTETREAADDAALAAEAWEKAKVEALEEMTATTAVLTESAVYTATLNATIETLGPDQAERLVHELEAEGHLIGLGRHDGNRVYTTPDLARAERTMLRAVDRLDEQDFFTAAATESAVVRMDAHLREITGKSEAAMTSEQRKGLDQAMTRDGVSIVEGAPGTGKSTVSRAITVAAEESGRQVIGCAPSLTACDVLRHDAALDTVMTTQRLANMIRKGEQPFVAGSVVMMDEAGFCGTKDMAAIMRAAAEAGAKVILLGDRAQLENVDAGNALQAISDSLGTSRMTDIQRQRVDWQRQASRNLDRGETTAALEAYDSRGRIAWAEDREAAMDKLVGWYAGKAAEAPAASRMVVATTNDDVWDINQRLREVERAQGRLGDDLMTIKVAEQKGLRHTIEREMPLAVGDRIRFRETLKGHGIATNDRATLTGVDRQGRLHLTLDKGGQVMANPEELVGFRRQGQPRVPRITHALATTTHGSQGQTVDHVGFYNSGGAGARTTLVTLTRHRHDAYMAVDCDAVSARLWGRLEHGQRRPEDMADIRAEVFTAAGRKEVKKNIRDFLDEGQLRAYVAGGDLRAIVRREAEAGTQAAAEEVQEVEMASQPRATGFARFAQQPEEPDTPESKPAVATPAREEGTSDTSGMTEDMAEATAARAGEALARIIRQAEAVRRQEAEAEAFREAQAQERRRGHTL